MEGQALSGPDAEGCRGREVLEPSDQATSIPRREELCHRLPRLQMGFDELLSQRPGSPGGSDGKEPACNVGDQAGFHPQVRKIPWRRKWQPTPAFLPGKSCGQRSLMSYSPWGPKGSDTTEQFHFHFSLSCIGEENGNPLQHSCLENPRDRGAWWAAVYGVTQSWT